MTLRTALYLSVLLSAPLLSQEIRTNIMYAPVPDGSFPRVAIEKGMVEIVGREFAFGPQSIGAVKNAPFSADEVTETTQVLADGNRIVTRRQGQYYRDSQGRTRVEHTLPAPELAGGEAPKMVTITDPVAHVSYSLDPNMQVAHKFSLEVTDPGTAAMRDHIFKLKREAVAKNTATKNIEKKLNIDIQKESLGTQNIEGVIAQGTRSTQTIPAGSIGNERPIVSITESWYSPELQMTVLTRNSDPRYGETVHRLTNIHTGDPDPAIFTVPAGVKTQEGDGVFKLAR